jgi:hypothetical protein
MLFTGAVLVDDRVSVEVDGVVDHFVAGFGYTADDRLVINTSDDPDEFVKGVGVLESGAVCATTTTGATDTFIEGVRVTAAGKLTYEDSGTVDHTTSGNPCASNGRLSVVVAV